MTAAHSHGEAPQPAIGFDIRESLRRADVESVGDLLDIARDNATDAAAFVEQVLAPVQRDVGDLWEAERLETARARLVTERVAAALDEIWNAVSAAPPTHPRVAVACVSGEWHDLAARMVATVLRSDGWDVVQLGPSVAVDTIRDFARTERPIAVALSCTQTFLMRDVIDAVDAVRACGVPVVAGGAAFGVSDRRARAIGADLWCANGARLAQQLHVWERRPFEPGTDPRPRHGERISDDARAAVLDSALRYLGRVPDVDDHSDLRSQRPAALLWFAEAAVLADDESVLDDAVAWWHRRVDALQGDTTLLPRLCDALVESTPDGPLRSLLLSRSAGL